MLTLGRFVVSIRDWEKPRYTIGAQSARCRICTMDIERYLCWTILIGLLESCAYVSYAGAFSQRTEPLLALAYHASNETPYRRFHSPDLPVSSFPSLWSRIRRSRDDYLSTVYLCVWRIWRCCTSRSFPDPSRKFMDNGVKAAIIYRVHDRARERWLDVILLRFI